MQHPFEGILAAQRRDGGRRSFLVRALGSIVAVCGAIFGLGKHATAQIYTTQAIGEEGGRPRGGYPPQRRWYRRNPFGGGRRQGARYTTFALAEEGGPVTTQAVSEEGGPYTTQALGEEGGYHFRRRDD